MHLHHIHPRAEGGSDAIDNAIPVCLDCHAEIEGPSNMGRRFSQAELREHRRRWLEICSNRPEIIVGAGRKESAAGPLESLFSELEYNQILLVGNDHLNDFATLVTAQFDRALSANAFASLEKATRDRIFRAYRSISETVDLVRAWMSHPPGGNAFNVLSNQIRDRRVALRGELAGASAALKESLGVETQAAK